MDAIEISHLIVDEACNYFGISKEYLLKKCKKKEVVLYRFFLTKYLFDKFPEVANKKFEPVILRERTSMMHGVKKINMLMSVYESDRIEYESLKKHLDKSLIEISKKC